ncbi:MAG: alpha/beta hydrolase [Clostridiales bacterium]|nr:alpha/beta hydrolase [Clostridiales bacterium]
MDELIKTYLFYGQTNPDGIIPYLSCADFDGLSREKHFFINSKNEKIAYFYYTSSKAQNGKTGMFFPGVGVGHAAYVHERATLCERGYTVLTFDYFGCGESDGENYVSLLAPARDALELIEYLDIDGSVVAVGHSLGGHTALKVLASTDKIKKAVIISGFFDFRWNVPSGAKDEISAYEKSAEPEIFATDVISFLKSTSDKIFFIHSKDDTIVPYGMYTGYIENSIKNANFIFHSETSRGHNPNYSDDAVKYMKDTFSEYLGLVSKGVLDTYEKKKAYMSDKSAMKMTVQDGRIFDKIDDFIKKG